MGYSIYHRPENGGHMVVLARIDIHNIQGDFLNCPSIDLFGYLHALVRLLL